ncbi:MAG: hypothetical protein CMN84_00750 [Spongiibacteraceae bacterium]|jgi:hypothetical protein|nr:hypothetical protein [Spongiibacteraceae bacterium]
MLEYIREVIHGNPFDEGGVFLKRFLVAVFIILGLLAAYIHFDQPVNTGTIVKGRIVSTAVSQNGYRSFTSTTRATIKLENGATLIKDINAAAVGDTVEYTVYKHPLTRRVTYR